MVQLYSFFSEKKCDIWVCLDQLFVLQFWISTAVDSAEEQPPEPQTITLHVPDWPAVNGVPGALSLKMYSVMAEVRFASNLSPQVTFIPPRDDGLVHFILISVVVVSSSMRPWSTATVAAFGTEMLSNEWIV